jgi:hypothetical protein
MYRLLSCCFLVSAISLAMAQQQSKTFEDAAGNKTIMNVQTGWTVIMKDGGKDQTSAKDVNAICVGGERLGLSGSSENQAIRFLCEEWWKLQPKTEIERMPFDSLMRSLLLDTGPSTTFVRYRGMELKTSNGSTTYDAAIVPSDVGSDLSCSIEEEDRNGQGMLYTYQCTIKTDSFPAAIALKNRMAQTARALGLKEDEIREHGLAVHAKEVMPCAPGGECLFQNVYATTMMSWKSLQIEADPVFTRNTIAELMAQEHGGHAAITGIASDEGTVSFQMFSVGRKNTQ